MTILCLGRGVRAVRRRPAPLARRLAAAGALVVSLMLWLVKPALASPYGQYNFNCNGCHQGGAVPVLTLVPSASCVQAGATVTLNATITKANGGYIGFDLATNLGSFVVTDPGTYSPGPFLADAGGDASHFTVDLLTSPGTATFQLIAVASNDSGNPFGDGVGSLSTVKVNACAGIETCGGGGVTGACGCSAAQMADFHADADGDGFGDPAAVVHACNAPPGYVSNGADCADTDGARHPGAAEVCNGLDDDCNGAVDDGIIGVGSCSTGLPGVCAAGASLCTAGAFVCTQLVQASAEACDGLDNDCNGQIDDGVTTIPCYTGAPGTEGVGVCHAGSQLCGGAAGYGACLGAVAPTAEKCDTLDNDCDGAADDGNPGGGGLCATGQLGVCSVGTVTCLGGNDVCVPDHAPTVEICNGLDDDCDGRRDDGCVDTDGDGLSDGYEAQIGTDPRDPDSDDDGLFDGTEMGFDCDNPAIDASLHHCIADADHGATVTDPQDPDTDHGGASDGSEDWNLNGRRDPGEGYPGPGNGKDDGQSVDTDGDGLGDQLERFLHSDPDDADTDDDGVLDGQEANPSVDMDGDGLIDVLDADSDDDGLFDGTEMGRDCLNPATDGSRHLCVPDADHGATVTDPLDRDTDHGGASDGSEDWNLNGRRDPGEGDAGPENGKDDGQSVDTDGDGLGDQLEVFLHSDPDDADTDDDGVLDGQEANPGADMDGDGLVDVLDADSDDDGLFDGTEMGKSCGDPATSAARHMCVADGDLGATVTCAIARDTDHGGASDGSEDWNLDGTVDPGETDPHVGSGADDGQIVDSDGDGLGDKLEIFLHSAPDDADTDDDGLLDGQEANPGADMDADGLVDVLDPDSDGDGLFDGTEMGKSCGHAATNAAAQVCVADGDLGTTRTSTVDRDTDRGSAPDGAEDANRNGVVDSGETDPTAGHGSDDVPAVGCASDSACGAATSGKVCDLATGLCGEGCRASGGNGCPAGEVCSSTDATKGQCTVDDGGGVTLAAQGSCAARPGGEGPWWLIGAAIALARRRRLASLSRS
jgi:hypothetical protein